MHIFFSFFFFNDTATTEIYTLSLHDALPICVAQKFPQGSFAALHTFRHFPYIIAEYLQVGDEVVNLQVLRDRKSTRLNSSHGYISYAVFCLKKKKYNLLLADIPS